MNLYEKVKIRDVVFILIGAILGGLLSASAIISGEALIGLLGVIIGAFIPSVFQSWAAGLDRKNQLRVAAIDRRLEVHQKAYSLWSALGFKAHNPEEIRDYVMECQKWWEENCLYLDPKARKAFRRAYTCADNHQSLLDERKMIDVNSPEGKQRLSESIKLIKENWNEISAAGQAIVEGVELPTISGDELEKLKIDNS